jgi:hypothetical protein
MAQFGSRWKYFLECLHLGLQRHTILSDYEYRQTLKTTNTLCDNRTCTLNPLKTELISICHLVALLGAHLIFHVSSIRVNIWMLLDFIKKFIIIICDVGAEAEEICEHRASNIEYYLL